MHSTPSSLRPAWLAFLFAAPAAFAHPGHDGHELTWDLGHLAAHPGATILCLGVVALGAGLVYRLVTAGRRSRSPRRDA